MNYPEPENNPLCQCKGNPMKAFFCETGHLVECHFPYNCREAACSHLIKYGFGPDEIEQLEVDASLAIASGNRYPYQLADENTVVIANMAEIEIETVICARCGEEYDAEMRECPSCGLSREIGTEEDCS